MDQLLFECVKEGLGDRVVVGRSNLADRLADAVCSVTLVECQRYELGGFNLSFCSFDHPQPHYQPQPHRYAHRNAGHNANAWKPAN